MNEAKLPSYFKSYPEWEFYFGYKFVGKHNIGTKWGGGYLNGQTPASNSSISPLLSHCFNSW